MTVVTYKIPHFDQLLTAEGSHAHADKTWYRYLAGIEDLNIRVVDLEAQEEINTANILDLQTRVQFIESQQTVQNNRLDGLEIAVFGSAGGTGEYGDGFGAGFAVS